MTEALTAAPHRSHVQGPPLTLLFAAGSLVAATVVGAVLLNFPSKLVFLVAGLAVMALAVATLRDLEVGLFILTFLVYTRTFDVTSEHGLPQLELPFVVVLLVVCGFVGASLNRRPSPRLPLILGIVGAQAMLLLASGFWATSPGRVAGAIIPLLQGGAVAVVITALLTTMRGLRLGIWAIVAAGLFLGGVSVVQHLTGSVDETYLGFAQAPVQHIFGELDAPRTAGPVGDPNFFALMMVVVVPLAIERFLHERSTRLRFIALTAAVVCGSTVILTFSRGGLLGLVTVLLLLLLRYPPHRGAIVAVALVGFFVVTLAPDSYTARLTGAAAVPGSESGIQPDGAVTGRFSEMVVAVRMFRDHPVTGVGVGNYPLRYQEYSRELGLDPRREERSPHSLVLEVAAETGLIGLTVFVGTMLIAFVSLTSAARTVTATSPAQAGLMVALRIGFIGFLVSSLFLHNAYPHFLWILVGLSIAAPTAARSIVPSNNNRSLGVRRNSGLLIPNPSS